MSAVTTQPGGLRLILGAKGVEATPPASEGDECSRIPDPVDVVLQGPNPDQQLARLTQPSFGKVLGVAGYRPDERHHAAQLAQAVREAFRDVAGEVIQSFLMKG